MAETPLHFRTITEISEAIASRQLSPVEITTAMLQRIDELDGRLKSYATVMADSAMNAAQKAEREIESGVVSRSTSRCAYCGEGSLFYKGCPHDGGGESTRRSCPIV